MAHVGEIAAGAPDALRAGTVRGREGFFRVGQGHDDTWWLLDPSGAPFYGRAVHGVKATCGGEGALPRMPAALLRNWGFNVAGVGSDASPRDDGLPFIAAIEFSAVGPQVVGSGVRLPDVFQPEWPQLAKTRAAEVCAPWLESRELLGWVGDSTLEWAGPSLAGRPSLLQVCLSLEPVFAAYHAAWEFVLALHGGRLDAVAHAWHARLPNKEVIRELTRAEEGLGTRGYLRDDARWTREFARRYFTTTAAAIRAVDANHLILGCRSRLPVGSAVLAECVYPAVDVAMVDWTELPAAGEAKPHPVIADNVCWARSDFLQALAGDRSRLTTVERMLRKGRASLERLARHPAVVGYAWTQWQDDPGEQPPFARGLIHASGSEAREHTEMLRAFNSRVEALRGAGRRAGTS